MKSALFLVLLFSLLTSYVLGSEETDATELEATNGRLRREANPSPEEEDLIQRYRRQKTKTKTKTKTKSKL